MQGTYHKRYISDYSLCCTDSFMIFAVSFESYLRERLATGICQIDNHLAFKASEV